MELDGTDPRASTPVTDPAAAAGLPVVIIGCGMSGLLAAIRVQQAGLPTPSSRRTTGSGGTWWKPPIRRRVDVGNHFYCYSFEPVTTWSRFFALELQAYFESVMDRPAWKHVRWNTEVTSATWDPDSATWAVEQFRRHDQRPSGHRRGGAVRPSFVPEVPGDFAGPAFHTARWDHDVADLTGKDVMMWEQAQPASSSAPAIAECGAPHDPPAQHSGCSPTQLPRQGRRE
ncbi:MAG: hypothetical protein R2789_19540 [Microthrixaceae bacterium]